MKRLLILSFLVCLAFSVESQKMVLMEKLTSPFCGECGNAAVTLEQITEEIPNVIWVSHHKPVGWIENPLMNPQSSQFWRDIDVYGTPLGMVDRKTVSNSLFIRRSDWRTQIEQELSKPAIANFGVVDASYDWDSSLIEFTVNVDFDSAPEAGPYRLTVMILEDNVEGVRQHNYYNEVAGHPHEGLGEIIWGYTHRNVVRAILDDQWGTPNVIPDNPQTGETYSHTFIYGLPDGYKRNEMSVICFVSRYDETNLKNRQVLNAAQFPFTEIGIGLTNTEEVTIDFEVNIFPNPATDFISVETEEIVDEIRLISFEGKSLQTIVPTSLKTDINTTELPSGQYVVFLEVDGKTSKKLVVVQ